MDEQDLFLRFGVALFIGLLIGLQREHSHGGDGHTLFAGSRTFPLLALVGCSGAMAAQILGSIWAFVAVFLVVSGFVTIGYYVNAKHDIGMTTEVAAVFTVLIGALCYWNQLELAVALGVTATALLSIKLEVQRLVKQISREDIYATLKFAVITAIVLPLLPREPVGPPPLDVLNPYNVWLMVVFISGISFLGYILVKAIGPSRGIGAMGFLGGLVSSTAVTLSFSERSRREPALAETFAFAILIAWSIMFVRVLVVVAVVNSPLLGELWIPLLGAALAGILYGLYLLHTRRTSGEASVVLANPFGLVPAIKFGLLYAAVLLIVRSAQLYVGVTGVYVSSILAGFVDVDAITVSMARLSRDGEALAQEIAARTIVIAVVSNTVVKGVLVIVSGARPLRTKIVPGLAAILAVGFGLLFLL